jgi:hypothetical protein
MKAVEVGLGILAGCVIGLVSGIIAGAALADEKSTHYGLDWFICIAAGMLFGAVGGGFLEAFLKSRTVAEEKLGLAFKKYRLNPDRLTGLAQDYPERIRKGIQAAIARDKASRPPPIPVTRKRIK